ncbi:RNA polymerase factor sigma-54 [Alicyclobacillus dauci]|uniref:RNA polymerase factor sigma-54 n=1 Tax=Alicyclobacillus dauci TaxID=1475485 RepID=A0ABY6Z653_9BACL|nr:RNA polymerase factor sigma-54 [Alicyclobacillus dauci]WAH38230.1 RNA polymerase factor sigma-54 [Alicyclobacillus dauci]
MDMAFNLRQEQSHKLLLTMEMKQGLDILQYSLDELDRYLEEKLADNPVAEYRSPYDHYVIPWPSLPGTFRRTHADGDDSWSLEERIRAEESIEELIVAQLRLMDAPNQVIELACRLVGFLDEMGYLREPMAELTKELNMSVEAIEEAINLLQRVDPPGIGARNIKECLHLQVGRIKEPLRQIVSILVEEHLDDLAAGRHKSIQRALRVSGEALQRAVEALRTLNPRPASLLGGYRPSYIIPDVTVEKVGSQLVVLANRLASPRIELNDDVWKQSGSKETPPDVRAYVDSHRKEALGLAKALRNRSTTVVRVADAILHAQAPFFERGRGALLPLTLRDIAVATGFHESTVSRTVRGKYMQTPHGVFELSYFFTSRIPSSGGLTSAEAVKEALRQLIATEDPRTPLSDDALATLLVNRGIEVSRRTIAKYRDEMGILSSVKRRRFG